MSTHRENLRNKVLAGITGGALTKPAAPVRSTAYLAQVTESVTEGFAKKVERLEAERAAGGVVLKLDPKRVAESRFANRHERSLAIEDAELQSLMADIRSRGQLEPIRVRAAEAGSEFDFEIVYGHRRHAACLALDAQESQGFRVLALLDGEAGADRDLVLKMYQENAARKDLSAFETGAMFASWLKAGVFANQSELAEAVSLTQASVAKYVIVAKLPEVVLAAFGDPRTISVRWAEQLAGAMKERAVALRQVALDLASQDPRPAPDQVLRLLLSAGLARQSGAVRTETVKLRGRTLYKIAPRGNGLQITFGPKLDPKLAKAAQQEVKDTLTRFLDKALKEGE